MPLSRLKRGGTLRRQWREPLSSVPSSKCQPAGGSVRTSISLHKLVMGRLVYSSSRRDPFSPAQKEWLGAEFFFFVHIHYNSDKLGQTHADGALISSPCSGFPFLPDSEWSKAPPILAITFLSGGQNSGAEHARSHRFPHFAGAGSVLRESVLFLTTVGTLWPSGCVSTSVMGNSREKTRQQSESQLGKKKSSNSWSKKKSLR